MNWKYIILKFTFFFLISLIFISCKNENKEIQKSSKKVYLDSISLGYDNRIYDIKKTLDNNYRILLNVSEDSLPNDKQYFLTINNKGKILSKKSIDFENPLSDYIETSDGFYVITTERVTMGESYTHDFISLYDKKWKVKWKKELKIEKHPAGNSFLNKIKGNLLLITDEYNNRQYGNSFYQFDSKKGELLTNTFFEKESNPNIVYKTSDNFLIISSINKLKENILLKKNIAGEIIWKIKLQNDFLIKEIIESKDNSFILFGEKYLKENKSALCIYKVNNNGGIMWDKTIKPNYSSKPGNVTDYHNNYIFSSALTKSNDGESFAYIFELNENGDLISDLKLDFELSNSYKTPFIIMDDKYITMISSKWIGKFGDPFHDIILINRFKKTTLHNKTYN